MLATIKEGVTTVIGFVGSVISAIFGTASADGGVSGSWSAILPVIGLGVGIFVIFFAVRTIKSLVQGY